MADDDNTTNASGTGSGDGGSGSGTTTTTPNPNEFVIPAAKTDAPAATPASTGSAANAGSATTAPKFEELIPAEYKDKAWAKDFARADKPFEAMAKAYEGALEITRKKDGIQVPGEGATPEQVEAFHKQIREATGVPADVSGYKVPTVEWGDDAQLKDIGEQLTKSRSADYTNGVMKILHEAGLSQTQVDKIWNGYEKLNANSIKKAMADNESKVTQQETEFKQKFDQRFGSEAKSVRERVAVEIAKHVPTDLAAGIDSLNDEQLMAVAVFAEGLRKQYGREDAPFGKKENLAPGDAQSLESRRMKLMEEREEVLKKQGIRSERYGQIESEMTEIRKQLAEAYK